MGIKSELHEAILKRGGKVPPYGGIAAAMDELNKLPVGGGGGGGSFVVNAVATETMDGVASADKTYEEIVSAFSGGVIPTVKMDMSGGAGFAYFFLPLVQYSMGTFMFSVYANGITFMLQLDTENGWILTTLMPE